jgi:hypothetical protein
MNSCNAGTRFHELLELILGLGSRDTNRTMYTQISIPICVAPIAMSREQSLAVSPCRDKLLHERLVSKAPPNMRLAMGR